MCFSTPFFSCSLPRVHQRNIPVSACLSWKSENAPATGLKKKKRRAIIMQPTVSKSQWSDKKKNECLCPVPPPPFALDVQISEVQSTPTHPFLFFLLLCGHCISCVVVVCCFFFLLLFFCFFFFGCVINSLCSLPLCPSCVTPIATSLCVLTPELEKKKKQRL